VMSPTTRKIDPALSVQNIAKPEDIGKLTF
jgi:hypothetical protein